MTDSDQSFSAFISYATRNKERAEEICASLEAKGFRCWMAPRDIRAGYEYADEIVRGIDRSRCMVVVLSEAANESPFVRREVERGVSKQKPIFPVRIEEVLPSPGLELFISATHWIDAWGSRFTEQVDRLAKDLSGFSVASKPDWKVRFRALRRRAARWSAAAAAVIAVALIVVLGGIVLLQSRPSNAVPGNAFPGARTGANASSNSAPGGSAAVIGNTGSVTQVPAGMTPATTAGGAAISDALREPYKQRALRDAPWMQCADGVCSLPGLRTWFAGVRRISFGETRANLDRSIDVVIGPAGNSESALREMSATYVVDYIPVNPGGDSVFSRLEFYDGTSSPVHSAVIRQSGGKTLGLRLTPLESPSNSTAPALFAGYTLGADSIRFMPDAPPGTAMVMYSLDEGGFLPAAGVGSTSRANRGFRFHGLPTGKTIRLELRMQNGDVVGPFRYEAGAAATLVQETMKQSLLSDIHALVRCTRVAFDFTQKSLAAARMQQDVDARRRANQITAALERNDLTFMSRGPGVGCRPDWQQHGRATRNYLGDWGIVDEIKFGTRPGRLGDEIKNPLTLADALANKAPRGREFAKLWHLILPADAEGVYVQLIFRDRTTSPEFRVAIDELKLQ